MQFILVILSNLTLVLTRLGWDRPRVPSEPGRRFSQDVALDFQLAILATQSLQLSAFVTSQHPRTLTPVGFGLKDPFPNRLLRRLELFRQLFRTPSSTS